MVSQHYRIIKKVVKLLITVTLCSLIISRVEWSSTWQALQQTNLIIVCIVFAGMILNVLVSTLKWKILLSIHGIQFDFNQLYKYYFTASFFNNFLPSTIGGDSYRIYKTLHNLTSKAGAVTSVFIERLTGIIALLIIGFFAGVIGYFKTGNEISRLVVIGGLLGIVFLAVSLLVLKITKNPLKRLAKKILPPRFYDMTEHLKDYQHQNPKLAQVILLSFFYHLFLIFYKLLLVYAVGASISITQLAVAVALSTTVALAPVSINGIGLLDGSFIYLLTNFHVNYEQAFLVMILSRLLGFSLGLIGGVFYLTEKSFFRSSIEK